MKRKSPLLSVIVPVYNVEKYLDTCMQSILNQTLHDIEVILVDDGSPDGCPQMCDEYAENDCRVKVVHKKNGGLGYARNGGLEVAEGKYVTFIDSDDYIELGAYETVCGMAEMHGLDEVRFSCNRFCQEGRFSNIVTGAPLRIYNTPRDLKQLSLYIFVSNDHEYAVGGSSCMAVYRRDVIERNNLRFESERQYISEDYIFNFKYYQCAQSVGYIPNTYYHYRVNIQSLTQTVRLDRIEKAAVYSEYVAEMMRTVGYSGSDLLFAVDYYVGTCRSATKSVFMSSMPISDKRKWFKEQTSSPYFRNVCSIYPFSRITKKQSLCLWLMQRQWFYLTYAFIVGFTMLRRK